MHTACLLCDSQVETVQHLCFAWEFTNAVCRQVLKEILHIDIFPNSWGDWQHWLLNWNGTQTTRSKATTALNVVVNKCWFERNSRVFQNSQKDAFSIVIECGRMIVNRFRGLN